MMAAGRLTSQALQDAAARLVAERRELPPGSVLRCFCRSVRAALLDGCSPGEVVAEAERITRTLLDQRPQGGMRQQRVKERASAPRVPAPRRAT